MMIKIKDSKLFNFVASRSQFYLPLLFVCFGNLLFATNNEPDRFLIKTDSVATENTYTDSHIFLQGGVFIFQKNNSLQSKSDENKSIENKKIALLKKTSKSINKKIAKRKSNRILKNNEKKAINSKSSGFLFSLRSLSINLIIQGSSGKTFFAISDQKDFNLRLNLSARKKSLERTLSATSDSFCNIFRTRPPPIS